ncbi:MAG: hypothetical protein Q8835_03100, partial [Sweet potato little leaf phytoplasma]|nr:hypothetical protein [Sweet potato little leaf phytoplasma]
NWLVLPPLHTSTPFKTRTKTATNTENQEEKENPPTSLIFTSTPMAISENQNKHSQTLPSELESTLHPPYL